MATPVRLREQLRYRGSKADCRLPSPAVALGLGQRCIAAASWPHSGLHRPRRRSPRAFARLRDELSSGTRALAGGEIQSARCRQRRCRRRILHGWAHRAVRFPSPRRRQEILSAVRGRRTHSGATRGCQSSRRCGTYRVERKNRRHEDAPSEPARRGRGSAHSASGE